MSTQSTPPLATRPRRTRSVRVPTQRAAARSLRRTATRTTGASWTRAGLPGRPRATAGVPLSESLVSLFVVALLCVPVAVYSGFATWSLLVAGAAILLASGLLWARRVVVGDRFVAVRQLGRYHVANVDNVRHLELRPSQHGGVLCVHTDDGRVMRLRRAEVARPQVNEALRAMAGLGAQTRDPRVEDLLDLTHDDSRIRHRYLADAVQ